MDWTVVTGVLVAALMALGLVGSALLVLPGLYRLLARRRLPEG